MLGSRGGQLMGAANGGWCSARLTQITVAEI
jgi:hypothetical protein